MDNLLNRRGLLRSGLALGGAGAAAALTTAYAATPAAARPGPQTLVFDAACLGHTLRIQSQEGNQEGDTLGSTYYVEALLYPEGTIKASGFDPASAQPIGHWFDRGWLLTSPDRGEPLAIASHDYLFGTITTDKLFPPDTLTSSGTEGTFADYSAQGATQAAVRAVTGGTGRFAGATGVGRQKAIGLNTTTLHGLDIPAPNYRFTFDLFVQQLPQARR